MLGGVLWVVVVVAFWMFVFSLMFTLVRWTAGNLDATEVSCPLPEPTLQPA